MLTGRCRRKGLASRGWLPWCGLRIPPANTNSSPAERTVLTARPPEETIWKLGSLKPCWKNNCIAGGTAGENELQTSAKGRAAADRRIQHQPAGTDMFRSAGTDGYERPRTMPPLTTSGVHAGRHDIRACRSVRSSRRCSSWSRRNHNSRHATASFAVGSAGVAWVDPWELEQAASTVRGGAGWTPGSEGGSPSDSHPHDKSLPPVNAEPFRAAAGPFLQSRMA